ncbi:MAG: tRNA-dihydrouridine synthase [Bdellovibrionales bacterium]|nr:tRNA-dihydrouridine synthase [Bdellovibrionales bacterium]
MVDHILRKTMTGFLGIDACVTEFLRVTDMLLPSHVFHKHAPELQTNSRTASGVPVYFQLLGGQPEFMAQNAARAVGLGAVGIDLNFGCPAKTVNRHDGGAVLLKSPQRLYDITKAVREAVPAHVTVSTKMRLGFEETSLCFENAKALEEAGTSWLTIHARTKKQMYQPPVDWVLMGEIKNRLKIPVIGNGDITTPDLAKECRKVSGCDHLMLGRGLLARPGLAHEIQTGAQKLPWPTVHQQVYEFYLTCFEVWGERFAASRLKQWLKFLSHQYSEGKATFDLIKLLQTRDQILPVLLQTAGLQARNEE